MEWLSLSTVFHFRHRIYVACKGLNVSERSIWVKICHILKHRPLNSSPSLILLSHSEKLSRAFTMLKRKSKLINSYFLFPAPLPPNTHTHTHTHTHTQKVKHRWERTWLFPSQYTNLCQREQELLLSLKFKLRIFLSQLAFFSFYFDNTLELTHNGPHI